MTAESTPVVRPDTEGPDRFTQDPLGWEPWLPPLPIEDFEERHWEGLVERSRAKMPYFALLARDPETLRARTLVDFDIFGNQDGGVPRQDRELSATVASVINGCVFCASVHARFASNLSGRGDDVQRLLDEGTGADLGERWNAIAAFTEKLTQTPVDLEDVDIEGLTALGLDDLGIADVIASAAFFNWANRLMLSLGEPTLGRRARQD